MNRSAPKMRVVVMDVWCFIPYYTRYLCEALAARGVDVQLASVSYFQDPDYFSRYPVRRTSGLLDIAGRLRIRSEKRRRIAKLIEYCINLLILYLKLLAHPPNVIHVQWVPLVTKLPVERWWLRMVRRRGIKLVETVHNVTPHEDGDRYIAQYAALYKTMDALIVHTREARERLVQEFGIDPRRIRVIPHGLLFHDLPRPSRSEARHSLDIPADRVVVLWQGVIAAYKGIDFLLRAWSEIAGQCPEALLLIAGTGKQQIVGQVAAMVNELGLQGSVRLHSVYVPVEALPGIYEAADIVTYPYREITMSGALMTGIAFGKPIIATSLPAFAEVLEDNTNALLVKSGDLPALTNALLRLIRNAGERERIAEGIRHLQDVYAWKNIAESTESCYSSVLSAMV